jgi:hypothetical protein
MSAAAGRAGSWGGDSYNHVQHPLQRVEVGVARCRCQRRRGRLRLDRRHGGGVGVGVGRERRPGRRDNGWQAGSSLLKGPLPAALPQ